MHVGRLSAIEKTRSGGAWNSTGKDVIFRIGEHWCEGSGRDKNPESIHWADRKVRCLAETHSARQTDSVASLTGKMG